MRRPLEVADRRRMDLELAALHKDFVRVVENKHVQVSLVIVTRACHYRKRLSYDVLDIQMRYVRVHCRSSHGDCGSTLFNELGVQHNHWIFGGVFDLLGPGHNHDVIRCGDAGVLEF